MLYIAVTSSTLLACEIWYQIRQPVCSSTQKIVGWTEGGDMTGNGELNSIGTDQLSILRLL